MKTDLKIATYGILWVIGLVVAGGEIEGMTQQLMTATIGLVIFIVATIGMYCTVKESNRN